jgi:hypothetical protein
LTSRLGEVLARDSTYLGDDVGATTRVENGGGQGEVLAARVD